MPQPKWVSDYIRKKRAQQGQGEELGFQLVGMGHQVWSSVNPRSVSRIRQDKRYVGTQHVSSSRGTYGSPPLPSSSGLPQMSRTQLEMATGITHSPAESTARRKKETITHSSKAVSQHVGTHIFGHVPMLKGRSAEPYDIPGQKIPGMKWVAPTSADPGGQAGRQTVKRHTPAPEVKKFIAGKAMRAYSAGHKVEDRLLKRKRTR